MNWIEFFIRRSGKKRGALGRGFFTRKHVEVLEEFLAESGIRAPITPILATITRGNWKIRNLGGGDYVLGMNCHLKDLYRGLPDAEEM